MLLSLVLLAEVTLKPTADIWVYPHAGDPAKDGYLRVWGREGQSVTKLVGDAAELSYSFLRFDPKDLPEGKLTKAILVLTLVADPSFSEAQAKQFPLQARPVDGAFEEKSWKYDLLERFSPTFDSKSVYGMGFPSPWPEAGKEGTIEIDLLKGPGDFRTALGTARKDSKPLGIALTSPLDVQVNPDKMTIYKLYSKDAPLDSLRPRLVLVFD